jgi:septal ring factor EnvC (AmiA/AmiB activator)
MLNFDFDFWDEEWPLIVAAPHIVLGGLAAAILILVVFLIVQLACNRQIARLKAESVVLNRRLRLASDQQDEVTRQLETVTTKVAELTRHIMDKATIPVLLDDTAKLSGTLVDLAHVNTYLAATLTTSRRSRAAA